MIALLLIQIAIVMLCVLVMLVLMYLADLRDYRVAAEVHRKLAMARLRQHPWPTAGCEIGERLMPPGVEAILRDGRRRSMTRTHCGRVSRHKD